MSTNTGKIPRHQAYECGIAPASYDLEHLIKAFGLANVLTMADAIANGRKRDVDRMLKKWTLHRMGDQFAMIDHICHTETAYGLTTRTAANNGASTEIME